MALGPGLTDNRVVTSSLKAIGAAIRSRRDKLGVSQEDAAHEAELGVRQWSRIETGQVEVRVTTLLRVASALGVSLPQLLDDAGLGQARARKR